MKGSEPHLGIFAEQMRKTCFSPQGSAWSFEGWVLLRISQGLAVRTFWSDLEKYPKSALGQILGGSGQHFGLGTFWCQKMGPEKYDFAKECFL